MLYLIVQTWLFLLIAWLIGMAVGFALSRDQKSQRHGQVEDELREERARTNALGKDVEDFRNRVTEMEGLPQGVRASRVAAREEMSSRIAQLERELDAARANEKRAGDETERLRSDVDGFRQRYLEARAKWDEYQAKAEALSSSPQLNLTEAHVAPTDTMRKRMAEIETQRERALDQAKMLSSRVSELERQLASAGSGKGGGDFKVLQTRIGELEAQLATSAQARERALEQAKFLSTRIGELEKGFQAVSADKASESSRVLQARIGELEAQLAGASQIRAEAGEQTKFLNTRISELEFQLAAVGKGSEKASETTKVLQARIADLEGRLATGISAARETDALRSRVADLQDKLGEAEVALSRAITTTRQDAAGEAVAAKALAEAAALRSRLSETEARLTEAQQHASESRALKLRLADAETRPVRAENNERVAELEKALERSRRQASEAESLRAQVTSLESRLALAQNAVDERAGKGEDVGLLKARLSDVEARLMSSSQASMEFESLRSRVMSL
ncbi:MAG: hypothetical protein ACKVRO_09860, partial [Micropepsaceae bacterium]